MKLLVECTHGFYEVHSIGHGDGTWEECAGGVEYINPDDIGVYLRDAARPVTHRVVRTIVYEGSKEWIEMTLASSVLKEGRPPYVARFGKITLESEVRS